MNRISKPATAICMVAAAMMLRPAVAESFVLTNSPVA